MPFLSGQRIANVWWMISLAAIPYLQTYVIEQGTKVLGFVSMVDNYLAALFIDVTQHNKGYGKQLLEFVKRQNEAIQLKVYQRNTNAIDFYLRMFAVKVGIDNVHPYGFSGCNRTPNPSQSK
ncbi:GNAT family N-acetyltransferase [Brevibacillus sp. AY1]|uniref:GNAT family N-acetyltransferase n=1 Tax=Brevibacillus sp. AY1 TaxID=2807621 RepID=UPI0024661797|nr:GNAT family N-acetyltransferase [Brevibacillus sp. AY1]